ncbi:MAG: hypothetical protein IPK13_06190 [Deltaproteobacteria bacterium]|nr:hypothetical protein [Deltaproteobacteria bacterium]
MSTRLTLGTSSTGVFRETQSGAATNSSVASSIESGAGTKAGWNLAAKRVLGLSDDEAGGVFRSLPLELIILSATESDLERLIERAEANGLLARVERVSASYETCTRHPRLGRDQLCRRCQGRACGACLKLTPERLCDRCAPRIRRRGRFRRARIAALLLVLAFVASAAFLDAQRVASWKLPVDVTIHPVRLAQDNAIEELDALESSVFEEVDTFVDHEAKRYGVQVIPQVVRLSLGRSIPESPPTPPESASPLAVILWSLKMRWWSWQTARKYGLEDAHVRLFVRYHGREMATLEHSLGLEKGRVGVVHLFADPTQWATNNVVIAHELLHIFGATDKYGPDGTPTFPAGYAEPERAPLHPQVEAEIMGGRIPLTPTESVIPEHLGLCTVGETTARELGWIQD